MSTTPQDNKPTPTSQEDPASTQPANSNEPAPTEAAGANAAPADPPAEPTPEARIAELEAQKADLVERLLRAHADMDNLRKRTEREKAEQAKFAISKFALDMVSVGDNFERAISAVSPDAAEADATLKGLLEGITMTERAFSQALERHGVKRIVPKGEPFDPHVHQAVMEQEDPSVPAGSVLQVFEAGYVIEERVLRPATVVVAKGGPKPAPPGSATTARGPEHDGNGETG